MIDHDDVRFSSFTRDLARRHRRPRSYPPPPSVVADALEQLCGDGRAHPPPASSARWPEDLSEIDFNDDEPS
jgi:hypothetical protein